MEYFTPSEAPIHETQRLPVLAPAKIVGRNQELGQTFAQVRAGMAVLLYGPSGVGKTALAATLAAAFTSFPGGVLWWNVNSDPLEQLIARLGRAYHDHSLSDSPAPLDQVEAARRLLQRDNRPLLILDGAPDLSAARDFVRKIAAGIPTIITNEISEPGPWTPIPLKHLEDPDAMMLFMQLAGLDQVSSVVRVDIQGIVKILRGLPLAITLAARYVRSTGQTPGEFLGTLPAPRHSGPLLGLNSVFQGLPEALQGMLFTLGATFDGRATSLLLQRLHPSPAETVAHVMGMLTARGLIAQVPCPAGQTCYRLHEMIQAFVMNWLSHAGRLEAFITRVVDAVISYAEEYSADSREGRDYLVAEMPNILSAASYAAQRRDGETLQRLLTALWRAFNSTGGYGYEIRMLEAMASTIGAPSTSPGIVAAAELDVSQMALFAQETPAVTESARTESAVTTTAPEVERNYDTRPLPPITRQQPTGAPPVPVHEEIPEPEPEPEPEPTEIPVIEEPEPVYEFEPEGDTLESADTGSAAWMQSGTETTQINQPTIAAEPVQPEAEIDALLAASQQAIAAGNARQAAASLNALGQALLNQERIDEAQEAFAEALVLSEQAEDADQLLVALESLAAISLNQGDLDNAVIYGARAENLASQRGDPARHGHLLALLGDIRHELGETDSAIETYHAAIDQLGQAGDGLNLGIVRTKLGIIFLDRSDFDQGIDNLLEANRIFEWERRADYQERALGHLGAAYGRLGQLDEAENYHRQAFTLARSMGDAEEQERQLENLAVIAQSRGNRAETITLYRRGLDLAYRVGAIAWQVRYLDVLGRLLMDDLSQVGTAVRLFEEAESLVPDEERARLLSRAQKRLERAQASGSAIESPPANIAAWASGVS